MDTVTMVELEGIKLYRDRRDGRHYASSSTTEGKHYYVTLASCQCKGFVAHQRCKHWAALQIATILQDGAPDPDICTECHGTCEVEVRHSRWVGGGKLGHRDQWSTLAPCGVCSQEVDAA